MSEAAAVDVERFEDVQHRVGRDVFALRPAQHVEVFLAGFERISEISADIRRAPVKVVG